MKIVTAAQMAAIEQASERAGVSTDTLMENAGLAVAQGARELVGAAGVRILILVGPGNNGADGLVAARHLRRWGAEVTCFMVDGRPEADPKMDCALEYGVRVIERATSGTLDRMLARSALVIDSILGTGQSRPLEGIIKQTMVFLANVRAAAKRPMLLALDLPTGLNTDTGEVDPFAVPCDITFSLGYPKRGLLAFPGAAHAGELRVLDIGVSDGLAEESEIRLETVEPHWVAQHLPRRPMDAHKGTFGHVLAVAGSRNYVGAAYLSSQACVRSGAGLTTLATPQSVYPIAAAKSTEPIHIPLLEDPDGRVSSGAAGALRDGTSRYTNILVGCGLGVSDGTVQFVEDLLFNRNSDQFSGLTNLPALVDADGLTNLARIDRWWEKERGPMVLTPHPGEMATLTGLATADIQQDRVGVAREYAVRWGVCLVLKGANTIISQPDGAVRLAALANPGMSTGGTGDVLSGVISGLMAQGLPAAV
ncbi:MAG: NAD(P)H-hydrate dehydratase, partial [bacterium]